MKLRLNDQGTMLLDDRDGKPFVVIAYNNGHEDDMRRLRDAWNALDGFDPAIVGEMIDMLNKLEWSGTQWVYRECQICGGINSGRGHRPDCALDALLARVRGNSGGAK